MSPRFAIPGDEALLRSIVLHPEVRKGAECDGAPEFDPTRYTQHPKSRALIVEGGCWLLDALEQDAYGVHTCLLPEVRGSKGLELAGLALEFVFTQMDAEQLWTSVPELHRQARWFAHAKGFRDQYDQPGAWVVNGQKHFMTRMRLDIDDWIQRSADLGRVGQWFHELRGDRVKHAHDPMHDRYVGAAIRLIGAMQLPKALHVYNRWARACGYHVIEPLECEGTPEAPIVRLDIGDAVAVLDPESGIRFEEKEACLL